ncbi:hypothetical protein DUI87_15910 [Hirundo rustica rustica]|uniref:Reverse transcriptase domain-containing protein n=1 Tax=Hirundo rustica rustica TaxID=333673 RepID=A0A3M0JZZ8_HIRRU|nr:hypothetical protein DUI87_15910 [Hirundo rustica rustica]
MMQQILMEALLRDTQDKEMIRDSQHSFIKGKSCLASLVAFCDEVTAVANKRKLTNIIDLGFHKGFNMVPQNPHLQFGDMDLKGGLILSEIELAGWMQTESCGQWL